MIPRTSANETVQVTLAMIDRIIGLKAALRGPVDPEQRTVYERALTECLAIKQRLVDRRLE